MKSVYEVLLEVENTNKKNEKESILLENKDNWELKECFRLAYSPTINFWIKTMKGVYAQTTLPKESDDYYNLTHILTNVLPVIYTRKLTGNDAKNLVGNLTLYSVVAVSDIVQRIVLKDMGCGVGVSTINKVWKNLIVKPPRQGAKSMSDASLKALVGKKKAIELKSDGSYFSYFGDLMSRNGNPVIIEPLELHLNCGAFEGYALEGEGIYDLTKATREVGNGKIGKIIKGTGSDEDKDGVIYQVWDCIEGSCYTPKGTDHATNKIRRSHLELMFDRYLMWCKDQGLTPKIQLIPRTEYVSMDEAIEIFESYVEQGFEGAILKDMDAPWKDNGKPASCVKLKRKDPADLLVVGIYEGTGKAKGSLGGVNLESEDGIIKVNCGSGFSDEQRKLYFDNPNLILGKIVEVEYDSITEDKKTLQKSLFLPIYKKVRDDKLEADSYEEILTKVRIKTK